jgi:hypothetical protein
MIVLFCVSLFGVLIQSTTEFGMIYFWCITCVHKIYVVINLHLALGTSALEKF